jgi:hypothetical protein
VHSAVAADRRRQRSQQSVHFEVHITAVAHATMVGQRGRPIEEAARSGMKRALMRPDWVIETREKIAHYRGKWPDRCHGLY